MATETPPQKLRLLSVSVQEGLRSAVKVPSLAHCLEELLLNSLAAGCGCAAARVNADIGRVQVADNGAGLERAALVLAGTRYHSSRASGSGESPGARQGGVLWNTQQDCPWDGQGGGSRDGEEENPRCGLGEELGGQDAPVEGLEEQPEVGPGCRGEALASIAHLSGLLEIVSRPRGGGSQTWVKLFRNGQAQRLYKAELARPSPGTTVTVCNLFYRLPVRRRRMIRTLEWEQIRLRVQALSLLHPGVSFTLRNEASSTAGGSLVIRLPKASSLPVRFAQIYGTQKAAALGPVQHSNDCFHMSGFISREGHHTKAQRLVFVNGRLVLKTRIHVQLDLLIRRRSLICRSGCSTGSRGSPDLHPVYIINVRCDHRQYDACWETGRTLLEFSSWDLLLNCLEEGVHAFLLQEKLLLEPLEEQENPQSLLLSSKPVFSHEMAAVQSKSVHRQAVLPETSKENAVYQGLVTIEKVGVLGAEDEEPTLENSGIALHSTEASKSILDITGQRTTACKKSLCKETGDSSFLSNLSTSDSPETQPIKLVQPSIERVLTKGDGIYQLAVAYESDSSSGTGVSPREEVKTPEGEVSGLQTGRKELPGKQTHKESQGVELGVTGFITHVIPKKKKGFDLLHGNCTERGHTFYLGPVSAWDISERLKRECTQFTAGGNMHLSATRECRKAKPRRSIRLCQKVKSTSQYHNQSGSCTESVTTPGKIMSVKDRINYKCRKVANFEPISCQARFCRKLSMPLITASLDTFRREYVRASGQDGGSSSQYIEVTRHDDGSQSMKSTPENAMIIKESDNLNQNVGVRCADFGANVHSESLLHNQSIGFQRNLHTCGSRSIAGHISQVQPSLIAQATYSQDKKITKGLPRTLAAKLSRLKFLGQGEKSWESNSRRSADCISPCQSLERLPELEHASPHCLSPEPQLSGAEANSDSCAGVVGEGSCIGVENTYNLAMINEKSNSEKLSSATAEERAIDGTVSQPELHPGDQPQTDETTEEHVSQQDDAVASSKESDLSWIPTMPGAAEADVCVGTCEGVNTLKCFPSQWLQYFDGSLGKTVYVNSVTGVSSYELPPESQTNAACTKDFTTMEVNVLMKPDATNIGDVMTSEKDYQSLHCDLDRREKSAENWQMEFNANKCEVLNFGRSNLVRSYTVCGAEHGRTKGSGNTDPWFVESGVTGVTYRCYPFRSENLIPFLPRSREERQEVKADEELDDGRDAQLGSSESLRSLFLEWRNPVFFRPPEVAVDVSSEQADNLAVKIHNVLYPYRFTKDMINSMQVLNQVDNKYIACLINTRLDQGTTIGNNLLVLVDQHAAHERVRLEQLISGSFEMVPGTSNHRRLCTSTVCPPIEISCTQHETALLRVYWKQLEAAGVQVEFRDKGGSEVLIRKVPACFIEREATEIRRGRQPVTQAILQEFLREQIEVLQSTGGFQGVLSRTVLKVLSSQACHGAVKFGDTLSVDECRSLINSLASCHLPFQCAHGRPSMHPLADLDHLNIDQEVHNRPNLKKLRMLREMWTRKEVL